VLIILLSYQTEKNMWWGGGTDTSARDDSVSHPNRVAQEAWVKEAEMVRTRYMKSFGSTRPRPDIQPAGGWITRDMTRKWIDPMGYQRIRHDVPPRVGLRPAFEAQGKVILEKLKHLGMDQMDKEYHELWTVPSIEDPKRQLTYRMENLVHTNNIVPASSLPADFESMDTDAESCSENEDTDLAKGIIPPVMTTTASTTTTSSNANALFTGFANYMDTHSAVGNGEGGGGGGYRNWAAFDLDMDPDDEEANQFFNTLVGGADDDDDLRVDEDEDEEEEEEEIDAMDIDEPPPITTAATLPMRGGKNKKKKRGTAAEKQRDPSFMSISFLQRRWLDLGYTKHQVGNAIGLCYMSPWKDTHVLHTGGRIHTTGTHNRRIGRLAVKYATCAYLKIAGVNPVRLKKRRAQNLVAGCSLPAPRGLNMHLLCAANGDIALPTRRFTGVSLRLEKRYPKITQTLLVFDYGNTIAVGSSSRRQIDRIMSHAEPVLFPHYRSIENADMEKEQADSGTIVGLSKTLAGTEQGQKRHETRRIRQERRVGHNVVKSQ
jgi:TATA-box binding protein (TBP) (component of TFIID and TFIIIB)